MPANRRGPKPRPALERFLALVDKTAPHGCWLWKGAINYGPGYGAFRQRTPQRSTVPAHRWAYTQFVGPIPRGLSVLHQCSRLYPKGDITYRRCVNPAHLALGTQRENLEQARAEGRASVPPVTYGDANNMTVLADEHLPTIRRLAGEGVTYAELGRRYGVRADTISAIVRGRSRRHVP
jgi:hypothetical protein